MIILKKGLFLNILFISFLLLSIGVNAQPYKAVNFPSKYADPTGEADYAASSEAERSSRIWFVCSDRNNNPTYTKPEGTKSKHSIDFLDKFYVIGEEGEYLRLAKSTSGNISEDIEDVDGEIYINGEDYGWVHKSKTLLWRSCLLSKTKMATKAMLLNTVEGIDPDKISASDLEKVAFYKTPSLNRKSDNSASLFEFFFVYKRDGDAVLLGKNNYIADYYDDFEDVIMGWVPENKVIQWNHRVVAERNWESPAVKERIANDTKAAVFFRDFDAKAYKEKNNVSEQYVLWKEKVATKKRDPGQRKRFPILEEDEDGMMRVGAMGQVYNYDGSIDRQAYEDIIKEAGDLKLSKRNINVVFVTDGTKGMDTYVKKIGAVVKNTKSYFESNDDNTIRFGAVVYRDKEAGNLTELKKLTPNSDAIVNFFSNEVSTHYDDDDVGDAVNMGIYTAIQRLGLDKEETNLIVLVGGSPNHEREDDTQRTEEELIQLLHDYDCHLFAFLVNNESDDHEELIYQVRNMVLGIANKKYDKLKGDAKFQEMLKKNPQYLEKPRLVPYPRKQNMYRLERTATMGSIYHAEYGSTLALKDFEDELEKILKEADIQTHQFLNRVEFKVWGYGSNKGSVGMADAANFGPSFLNFLLRSNLSEAQIKKIRDDNIQLYQPGYAPKYIDGHEFPLFKPSLFLTQEELLDLHKQIKKFSKISHGEKSGNKARLAMQNIYKDIVKSYLGSDEKIFEDMDLLEINKLVFGLPGNSDFLRGVTPADIVKQDRFSNADFNIFAARIDNKLQKLTEIVDGANYAYKFNSNNKNYYWISEDFIP